MPPLKEILIAGAGPSGLAAGIFLSELGYKPRIIDKKTEISPYSKALGVNPHTLELLEPVGVTKRFLENGRIMPAMNAWKNGTHLFRNDFSKVKHRFPFLIVQPQKESEEILRDELQRRNIPVEYGVQLDSFEKQNGKYVSTLSGKISEQHTSDFIIAADGGHSTIRKQLKVDFTGMRYKESWELYDVELEISLPPDEVHIRIFPNGGMFMIRVRGNMWRVAGNLKDLLSYLPPGTKTGKVTWETEFFISQHVAGKLTHDNIVLIGDAAHLHSPLGGRGMNLGIEDAHLVSKFIHEDRLGEYNNFRRPYLVKTVTRINFITSFLASRAGFPKLLKYFAPLAIPFFPLAKPAMRNFAMGLDNGK